MTRILSMALGLDLAIPPSLFKKHIAYYLVNKHRNHCLDYVVKWYLVWLSKYVGVCVRIITVLFISVSKVKSDMSEGNPVDNATKCPVHI